MLTKCLMDECKVIANDLNVPKKEFLSRQQSGPGQGEAGGRHDGKLRKGRPGK